MFLTQHYKPLYLLKIYVVLNCNQVSNSSNALHTKFLCHWTDSVSVYQFFYFFYFFLKHELIALPYLSEIERNESVVYNITNPIDHWTRDTLA
jgi:hypothetical protein